MCYMMIFVGCCWIWFWLVVDMGGVVLYFWEIIGCCFVEGVRCDECGGCGFCFLF